MKRIASSALVAGLFVVQRFRRRAGLAPGRRAPAGQNRPHHEERTAPAERRRRRPPITEAEVNSYLRYELGDRIPAGVTDPWVSILENGRLSGKATVDLARVGQSRKSSGMLDPFNFLTGSMPLAVNGVLRTKNGVGNVRARVGLDLQRSGAGLDGPGNRELLLEVGVGPQGCRHRQAVRAAHRASARFRLRRDRRSSFSSTGFRFRVPVRFRGS